MERKEKEILTELAKQTAEIAALPVQQETKRQWIALNKLQPERPMFTIDQVCWNEMDVEGELACVCTDPFLKELETKLRRQLYTWRHMRDDVAIEPIINIPMVIDGFTYGLTVNENVQITDAANDIVSHEYHDQLKTEEDLQKLKFADIQLDREATARREAVAHELFDGILEVRMNGIEPSYNIWDKIAEWRGMDNMLTDLVDDPDLIHHMMRRITDISLDMIDQLETKGLLCQPQQRIHCSGAWTDELPQEGYNPHPKAKDIWVFGMAQIFSTVGPAMHEEFEIDYVKEIYARFGLVYYGCCEPLDRKIDIVRKLPNVRKIAMSPWADPYRGAEGIGGDYVFSNKPTPAHLAVDWDPALAAKDVDTVLDACRKHGCPVEFLLKDISTVARKPQNLWEWAKILRERCGSPAVK